jgi:hypothetical protein
VKVTVVAIWEVQLSTSDKNLSTRQLSFTTFDESFDSANLTKIWILVVSL